MNLTKIGLTRKEVSRADNAISDATRISITYDTSVAMVDAVLGAHSLFDQIASSTLHMAINVEVARSS